MKYHTLPLILGIISILSCDQSKKTAESKTGEEKKEISSNSDQSTMKGTLEKYLDYFYMREMNEQLTDDGYFYSIHKDEIHKTLEIVEKDSIPGKDFILVFFRYSVGAEVAHRSFYLKQIDGKWFIHTSYYSSYQDDPYKNGKPEEAKKMLAKVEDWEKGDDNIWWK